MLKHQLQCVIRVGKMKVLVTGGAGFIGSHVVDKLIAHGYEVCIVDNLSTGKQENINPLAKLYIADIVEADALEQVFALERPDFVIHHAAQIDVQTSMQDPALDAKVNILGSINLVKCSTIYKVQKLIYASSAAVYGNPAYLGLDEQHTVRPVSFYGISKHTLEHYLQVFAELNQLSYCVLRYANVYGPRQDSKGEGGVVAIFIDKLLSRQSPFIFGDGEQTRDFVYVKDIAAANLAALGQGSNDIFNISSNSRTSVNEVFRLCSDLVKSDLAPIYKAARAGDIVHSYLANNKAVTELGWSPRYSLYQGLKETISHYSAENSAV